MSQQTAKIQFLLRMNHLNGVLRDLAEFLTAEKLVDSDTIKRIFAKNVDFQAQELYLLLAKNEDTFHLVDWEWVILPEERMKLTIVARNGVKEFAHGC